MIDILNRVADIVEPHIGSNFKLRQRALGTAENLAHSNLLVGQQSTIQLPSQEAAANLLHCTFNWPAAERIAAELHEAGLLATDYAPYSTEVPSA
ncbi:hypothetical protein [Actinoplanes rectilineatus]|uniref:hypothetical protein n=1 Tax=Actinoplanes rectilineatus TaxID=113571 RepID=UPI0005F2C294|nr:hypothetical protein [Actinoplanes rectilineatus]